MYVGPFSGWSLYGALNIEFINLYQLYLVYSYIIELCIVNFLVLLLYLQL